MTTELVVIGVMATLLLIGQWIHFKERSDLLDRLMARDFPELATWQMERQKAKTPAKLKNENLIPL